MNSNKPILLLNGPNLNLLGEREPEIYGHCTLEEINQELTQLAEARGYQLLCFQSNHEGVLIDRIQDTRQTTSGLIINPGGLAHTSVALRDAAAAYIHPIIEVHLSNIYQREAFRHHSYLSAVVSGVICGLGGEGYRLALEAMFTKLKKS